MAERKKKSSTQLRPLEGQVRQFAVLGEMTGLLQRVRGNKSKRSASALVKEGPFRVQVIAMDEGGELEDHSAGGPFTIQCLLGRVMISAQGQKHRLTTGDLLVADSGITHSVTADEASILLVTVAALEDTAR